jgi:hypothetical protein
MPKLRVHNIAVSVDGYAAGPDQSLDNPLGVGGTRLHEWAFATRSAREMHGMDGDLDGGPDGYECVELVSSPSVAHVRFARTPK